MNFLDKVSNAAKKAQEKVAEALTASQNAAQGGIDAVAAKARKAVVDVSSQSSTDSQFEAMHWLLRIDNDQKGPVSAKQMQALLHHRMISPQCAVWRKGMTDWMPLAAVAELAPILTDLPPLVPGQELVSFPTNLKVSADLCILPVTGSGVDDVRLVVDDQVIAWSPLNCGMSHIEFESSIGQHTIVLEIVDENGEPRLEKRQEFEVVFSLPGHYSLIGAKGGYFATLPKSINLSYSPIAKDSVQVPPSRKNSLHGLWEQTLEAGSTITFTPEGVVRCDNGAVGQYFWQDRNMIRCEFDKSDIRFYSILALGKTELLLKLGDKSQHFKKGLTESEIEAAYQESIQKQEQQESRARNVEMAASLMKSAAGLAAVAGAGAALGALASKATSSSLSDGESSPSRTSSFGSLLTPNANSGADEVVNMLHKAATHSPEAERNIREIYANMAKFTRNQ
jgi:hypothetical protein